MPYHIEKNKDGSFRVIGPSGVHSKHTTKAKAEAQIRVMEAATHEKEPKKKRILHG
jgi:hypothetical protein